MCGEVVVHRTRNGRR